MDANRYKQLKERGDVLDFATLNDTRRILAQRGQAHLADLITRVLLNDKIDKPSSHSAPRERFSDFYRVSLAAEDVATVVSILFDYEAEVIGINPSAADLINRWNNLNGPTRQ